MRKQIVIPVLLLLLNSCSVKPQPISYGSDDCDYCRMMITDQKFGAEIVTKKGRVFKFDSGECMINFLKKGDVHENEISSTLVVNTAQPGKLIDAAKAIYLHSEKFPSPMGAFLSAFETQNELKQFQDQYGGEIWTWDEARKQVAPH